MIWLVIILGSLIDNENRKTMNSEPVLNSKQRNIIKFKHHEIYEQSLYANLVIKVSDNSIGINFLVLNSIKRFLSIFSNQCSQAS